MAKKPTSPPPSRDLTPQQMQMGVRTLARRIGELNRLDPAGANWDAESSSLPPKVHQTGADIFGEGTAEFERWRIWGLNGAVPMSSDFGGRRVDPVPYRREAIADAIGTLQACKQMLEEKLEDLGYAPSADGYVPLDHNQPDHKLVIEKLITLEGEIKKSNSYDDEGDRMQRIAEIAAGRRLLDAPRVRTDAIAAVLLGALTYLASKFADGAIGAIAGGIIKLLAALLGIDVPI